MASRRPKLPPEPFSPPPGVSAPRRTHLHVVPVDGGWGIRVGRRIEKTFAEQVEAVQAAIPLARERDARLFTHYPSGEIRESGTTLSDEKFLQMWEMAHEDDARPEAWSETEPDPVHLVREGERWAIRVGDRTHRRFKDRNAAVQAAMRFARNADARLFMHYDNGEVREAATGVAEELLLKAWKQIRAPGGWLDN